MKEKILFAIYNMCGIMRIISAVVAAIAWLIGGAYFIVGRSDYGTAFIVLAVSLPLSIVCYIVEKRLER